MMNEVFYVLIVGSRSFSNYDLLEKRCNYLLKNYKKIIVVSGGANGADSMARHYAKQHNLGYVEFPAKWDLYGKRAGFIRNEEMHKFIADHPERGCICFWDGASKGTQHNFGLCKRFNTPLRVVQF